MQNILFFYVDELRYQLGCCGQEWMRTPHLDRLAGEGTLFERAYCQFPICGASRASTLTGLRPTINRFRSWDTRIETDAPGALTLPEHFRVHGYATRSVGPIFHHPDDCESAWSEGFWMAPKMPFGAVNPYALEGNRALWEKTGHGPPYESAEVEDNCYDEGQVAEQAMADLDQLVAGEKPFFLGVGFLRPHLPFAAPKRYWDLYQREKLPLATNPYPPRDAPAQALTNWQELRNYAGMPQEGPVDEETARTLVHGYCAATSYMDAQVGRVLERLDALGQGENTVVIFLTDHGDLLGAHGFWCKQCLFEESLHCPLIVRAPKMPAGGRAAGLVENLDVFPTLCDLAGLPVPEVLQGRSFRPLLEDENAPGKDAVFSRHGKGASIKTDRYRYSEYRDDGGEIVARMLYDHQSDPGENVNIVDDPATAAVRKELADQLANCNLAL